MNTERNLSFEIEKGNGNIFLYVVAPNFYFDRKLNNEMIRWCKDTFGQAGGIGGCAEALWSISSFSYFQFRKYEHAVLFVLAFTGRQI